MITRRNALMGAAVATLLTAMPALAAELDLPRQKIDLVAPPFVHPHEQATTQKPKIIEFRLVVQEKEIVIDDQGTKLRAMTYNGSIPGPMMVVHEGDYLELTLVESGTNSMPHNIDFHAATGALGGAELTLINPGEQVVLRFKATRPGVFVYHCAPGSDMTPWHVTSGMSGVVMVLPRAGLSDGKASRCITTASITSAKTISTYSRQDKGKFKTYTRQARPMPTPSRSCASSFRPTKCSRVASAR